MFHYQNSPRPVPPRLVSSFLTIPSPKSVLSPSVVYDIILWLFNENLLNLTLPQVILPNLSNAEAVANLDESQSIVYWAHYIIGVAGNADLPEGTAIPGHNDRKLAILDHIGGAHNLGEIP